MNIFKCSFYSLSNHTFPGQPILRAHTFASFVFDDVPPKWFFITHREAGRRLLKEWPSFVCQSVCPSIPLSCWLHISCTIWKSSLKLIKCWSVRQCAEPIAHGKGQCLRSCDLPLEGFSVNFVQMLSSVRQCAESTTQGKGHSLRSWNLLSNFVLAPYLFCSRKIFFKL